MARIYISLGTSIERDKYLIKGLTSLEAVYGELELSSLFESQAVGFSGPDFFNMVIAIKTEQSLQEVANTLKAIEFSHGRAADATKYSPRTLDLDLLLFDDLITSSPVQLPRDEITKNAFVLWPLAEIAAEVKHPVNGITFAELWQQYNKNQQVLKKVPFTWPLT